MSMITVQKMAAVLLMAGGAFIVWQGSLLTYYGRLGPGPGFLPVWVGGALLVLSTILLVQSFLASNDGEPFLPEKGAYKRPLLLALACLLTALALPVLGFRLTIFVFVLLVPLILGRQRWFVAVAVAAVMSFGTAYLFENLLNVRLPHIGIDALRALGL
ncbi:MAG: hypothetical protein ABS76_12360 [Pelagibacterium sp. SCN 64-44]|nr:MAG: hypothetical protein ABS76_12360 [Pelagibacterium sp. SCN 64-44]